MEIDCAEVLAWAPSLFQPAAWGDRAAVIQLNLDGPKGGRFFLEASASRLTVNEGTAPHADATVDTSDELFVRIILNLANPMTAYMARRVRVRGKMNLVMRLISPKVLPRDFGMNLGLAE